MLDRFGRIAIPKRIRDNLHLGPGSPIRIEEVDDGIVIKPIYGEPNLVDKDGVLVFSGAAIGSVEDALGKHRMERSKTVVGRK